MTLLSEAIEANEFAKSDFKFDKDEENVSHEKVLEFIGRLNKQQRILVLHTISISQNIQNYIELSKIDVKSFCEFVKIDPKDYYNFVIGNYDYDLYRISLIESKLKELIEQKNADNNKTKESENG